MVRQWFQQNYRSRSLWRFPPPTLFELSLVLTLGVYVFGAAYLVSPLFGWHLDVASMAAAFGALPVVAKFGIKTVIAFPFTYHSLNGLRHLAWDTGSRMTSICEWVANGSVVE